MCDHETPLRRTQTLNAYLRKLGPLAVIGALLFGGTAGCERKERMVP
jgi:hypothetical protein